MSESRYAILPAAAIDDPDLTAVDFRVLGVIGYHSGRDRHAYPKQSTIAERLGFARETVNRAVKRLASRGYIQVTHQFRTDGGKRENLYFVSLDPHVTDGSHTLPVVDDEAVEAQPAPPHVTDGSHTHVTPAITSHVTPAITSKDEHPIRTLPPTPPQGAACVEEESTNESEFDRLWHLWPDRGRERSKGEVLCRAAFEVACSEHTADRLIAAANAFLAKTEERYVPGLHRWLQTRRFEHFLPSTGAVAHPAPEPRLEHRALTRPPGRAGECLDAIIERHGQVVASSWFSEAAWSENKVRLPNQFLVDNVGRRFGIVLARHGFEPVAVTHKQAA